MFSPSEQSACDMTYTQHTCDGGKTACQENKRANRKLFHKSYSSKLQTPSFLGASSVKRKHPAQMRKSPLDLMLHLLVFITARQSTELTSQQWKNSKVSNKRVSRKGTYTSRHAHAEQVTPHFAVCLRSSADWPQSWTSSGVKLPCLLRTSDLTCAMQE